MIAQEAAVESLENNDTLVAGNDNLGKASDIIYEYIVVVILSKGPTKSKNMQKKGYFT